VECLIPSNIDGTFLETAVATYSQHDIVKLEAEGIKQEVKPEIL
jgi:hypothetical protein